MKFLRIFNMRLTTLAVFMIIAIYSGFVSSDQVLSQSGRGSPPDRKKKPETSRPPTTPIHEPGQGSQDNDITIRINSDLVTVVATVSRRTPKNLLDLSRED